MWHKILQCENRYGAFARPASWRVDSQHKVCDFMMKKSNFVAIKCLKISYDVISSEYICNANLQIIEDVSHMRRLLLLLINGISFCLNFSSATHSNVQLPLANGRLMPSYALIFNPYWICACTDAYASHLKHFSLFASTKYSFLKWISISASRRDIPRSIKVIEKCELFRKTDQIYITLCIHTVPFLGDHPRDGKSFLCQRFA